MKKLATLLTFGAGCLVGLGAHAQAPDKAEYRQRFEACNTGEAALRMEIGNMLNDKQIILQEYMDGEFCSDCGRSKTEVERETKRPFSRHIAEDKDRRVVRASQAKIDAKTKQLNDAIRQKEAAANAKRNECDRIAASYDKAQKEAQARAQQAAQAKAQQEAQAKAEQEASQKAEHDSEARAQAQQEKKQETTRKTQHDSEARAQQEADEKKQEAAQQEQESQADKDRQMREIERHLREEAERVRQAKLAANILLYQNRLNSIEADTKSRLEEQRQNSTLNGTSTFSSASKQTAQGTVASTNSGALGKEAFGGDDFLTPSLNYIREKRDALANKIVQNYAEKKLRSFFGEAPLTKKEKLENDPITHVAEQVKSDAVHYIKDKFMQSAPPQLQAFNRMYERAKAEYASYEPVTLTKATGEVIEYIGRGTDVIMGKESSDSFDAYSKEFWDRVPKRFLIGIPRNYLPGPRIALIKEISGNISPF